MDPCQCSPSSSPKRFGDLAFPSAFLFAESDNPQGVLRIKTGYKSYVSYNLCTNKWMNAAVGNPDAPVRTHKWVNLIVGPLKD